jgi:hypothetical protein
MPLPQQQDAPGTDEQLQPHADHDEESYRGSAKLEGVTCSRRRGLTPRGSVFECHPEAA